MFTEIARDADPQRLWSSLIPLLSSPGRRDNASFPAMLYKRLGHLAFIAPVSLRQIVGAWLWRTGGYRYSPAIYRNDREATESDLNQGCLLTRYLPAVAGGRHPGHSTMPVLPSSSVSLRPIIRSVAQLQERCQHMCFVDSALATQ